MQITEYEMGRISTMKENNEKILSLGIMPLVACVKNLAVQNSTTKSKADDKDPDNDEEYNPEKDDGVQSDDTSEVNNNKI